MTRDVKRPDRIHAAEETVGKEVGTEQKDGRKAKGKGHRSKTHFRFASSIREAPPFGVSRQDKTFGLKNKKGRKQQQFVKSVTHQVLVRQMKLGSYETTKFR